MLVHAAEETRGCPPLMAAIGRAAALGSSAFQGQPRAEALLQCAQLLLEAGADANQAAKDGSTALHAAAEGGSLPALGLLLAHRADIEAEEGARRTPLARAASAGMARHRDCIMLLLARGAAVAATNAPRVLDCLLRAGSDGGTVVTVWHLLARLATPQLRALSACPSFYDLPHTEAPEQPLPPAAVDAMLELAAEGCSNLLYNVSPAQNTSQGRRPAYLFELLTRSSACHPLAAHAAAEGGDERDMPCLRLLVAGSTHVAKMLANWASVQMLLQYASCIARCRGVPQADREQLSLRVGHLFSAYHSLGSGLCSALHLSLSAGVEHPNAPLVASSAAALGPPPAPLMPAPSLEPAGQAATGNAAGGGSSGMVGEASGAECAADEERHAGLEAPAGSKLVAGQAAAVTAADSDVAMPPAEEQQLAAAEDERPPAASAAEPAAAGLAAIAMPAASAAPVPAPEPAPAASGGVRDPREEPAIAAALRPFADAIDCLVGCISDQTQMRAWHFLLEYREVASLACKQRLLQSVITAWPRRTDAQLPLATGRAGVLQRVCSEVEGRHAGGGASEAGSIGGALWQGLKVAFDQEHGVGDGVRREWFRLLAAELTNPDTGLFESHDGGATFSPAPHANVQCDGEGSTVAGSEGVGAGTGHLQKFEMVGCLAGLGIMQGCTLPGFSLTSATWRAVLGQPSAPDADLAASDPLLHRNLQLLGGMGAGVADLRLHFEVHDALGRRTELCPGGASLAVTAANLARYVAMLARHKCVDSLAAESAALAKGLCGVLTHGVVDMLSRCFGHAELNAMLAGVAELELPDWKARACYEQCSPSTDQVTWLWAALEAAQQPVRRQLLAFVTGSASLPAGGFAALRGFNGALHPFTVCVVAVEGDDRLPRASTCFNTLFLPRYSSAAVLEARVTQAISSEQSFDEAVIRR